MVAEDVLVYKEGTKHSASCHLVSPKSTWPPQVEASAHIRPPAPPLTARPPPPVSFSTAVIQLLPEPASERSGREEPGRAGPGRAGHSFNNKTSDRLTQPRGVGFHLLLLSADTDL